MPPPLPPPLPCSTSEFSESNRAEEAEEDEASLLGLRNWVKS